MPSKWRALQSLGFGVVIWRFSPLSSPVGKARPQSTPAVQIAPHRAEHRSSDLVHPDHLLISTEHLFKGINCRRLSPSDLTDSSSQMFCLHASQELLCAYLFRQHWPVLASGFPCSHEPRPVRSDFAVTEKVNADPQSNVIWVLSRRAAVQGRGLVEAAV
jgi:hypothetical protein